MMIRRVNHIAIAVPSFELASATYRKLGVKVSEPQELPEHGVRVSFMEFENLKLEPVEAFGDGSPIQRFMEKSPGGGMHHLCLDVEDLEPAIRVLGSGEPKIGAHGNPVVFAHPSDLFGVLTEFEQVPATESPPP